LCFCGGTCLPSVRDGPDQYFTEKKLRLHVIQDHRAYAMFVLIGLQGLQVAAAPVPGEMTGFAGGVIYSTTGLTT